MWPYENLKGQHLILKLCDKDTLKINKKLSFIV